ncbi:hypothetical protein FWG76_02725 [Candidatus Saccharibacteria bacterium]|nr:hypothetical protein [Candidatus Saccharibacteria bacterium]
MSSVSAIINGGLSGNSRFFGSNTSELVAQPTDTGSWNVGFTRTINQSSPWQYFGGMASSMGSGAGVLSFAVSTGGVNTSASHRTILLGY